MVVRIGTTGKSRRLTPVFAPPLWSNHKPAATLCIAADTIGI